MLTVTMLRLVCTSTVIPFAAVGAIASPKIRFLSIGNALRESPIVSGRHFSSDSGNLIGRRIVGAIKSQIKSLELDIVKTSGLPADLPFTVEDDDRYCHIMLKRELGDERIEVTVNPVHDVPQNNSSESEAPSVRINVSISKENKGTLDLGANVCADLVSVNKISFSEPNTYVPSLSYHTEAAEADDLEEALYWFVRDRGIEASNVGFLYKYMVEKRRRWGTVWVPGRKPETDDLKKLMKFVEDWHKTTTTST
ncbi:uncharacterized protein At2g39795, mitochondrial-like [Salvia miltiorrhiza]|uniref:uncharacterized protein At2g39795, mitochondrial-like n=1 Tax=Salvia miltiorrhiza TaxID=226208 RepID=UPI0025AC00C1|nr:uncharacterized protein At2g39795, mitochondrial-like [Salvia miltiorrhiza]